MNKYRFPALVSILCLLLSCDKEQVLSVNQTELEFNYQGGASEVMLTASQSWTAASDQSWCSVSPESGSGGSETVLSVSCTENAGLTARQATITLNSGGNSVSISVSQGARAIRAVSVDLMNDLGENGFIAVLDNSHDTRFSIGDYPVFFYKQEGDVEVMYYNPSSARTSTDSSSGVLVYHYHEDGTWAVSHQGTTLIINRAGDDLYNAAIIGGDGSVLGYYYGLTIKGDDQDQHPSRISTKMTGEDWWHFSFSAVLKLSSFIIQACSFDALGIVTTATQESWKSDLWGMQDAVGEDTMLFLNDLSTLRDLENWDIVGHIASLINDMADEELDKVGRRKPAVVAELGPEWIIRITPADLMCINNDDTYTVKVESKANWKVDDTDVDKSWCSVERSGDDLVVTIKQTSARGPLFCHALVKTAVEVPLYHITPARLDIQLLDAQFSVQPQEIVLPWEGGTKEVSVNSSNFNGWHIDEDTIPEWCSVQSSHKNNTISVSAGPSEKGHEAETFTVFGEFNDTHWFQTTVTVRQEKSPEEQLRDKLIQFYYDTDGPNWKDNYRWCTDSPISEWYGISFDEKGLMYIDLHGNNLSHGGSLDGIDILKFVDVSSSWGTNSLEHLSVAGCTALEELNCKGNQMTSLDVSGCSSLKYLDCRGNKLTKLNHSGCSSMIHLLCSDNHLTSINVSSCQSLIALECARNRISSLNVSGCSSLQTIGCDDNFLSKLSINNLPSLEKIACGGNDILTDVTVTNCRSLTSLYCGSDPLKHVNISGCTSLPDVVIVKSEFYIDYFEYAFGSYAETLETLNVSGCTGLTYLEIDRNPHFSSVDVSGCSSLSKIIIGESNLSSLNVSGLTALTELTCIRNTVSSIDVSGCTSLRLLDCFDTNLSSIDISGCPSLERLWCDNTHIIQQITVEDGLLNFIYDQRYEYYEEWDPEQGKSITKWKTNPYGWYYLGEPQKGYHGR